MSVQKCTNTDFFCSLTFCLLIFPCSSIIVTTAQYLSPALHKNFTEADFDFKVGNSSKYLVYMFYMKNKILGTISHFLPFAVSWCLWFLHTTVSSPTSYTLLATLAMRSWFCLERSIPLLITEPTDMLKSGKDAIVAYYIREHNFNLKSSESRSCSATPLCWAL